jgi:hypothetical protein
VGDIRQRLKKARRGGAVVVLGCTSNSKQRLLLLTSMVDFVSFLFPHSVLWFCGSFYLLSEVSSHSFRFAKIRCLRSGIKLGLSESVAPCILKLIGSGQSADTFPLPCAQLWVSVKFLRTSGVSGSGALTEL